MLYLGIDQHARQLTISLRDESGDVLQARQMQELDDRNFHRRDLFGCRTLVRPGRDSAWRGLANLYLPVF